MSDVGDQVLTFRVGESELAARVSDIRQVFRGARLTRVPQAPASLAGVASLRGEVVPVVSVARLLGQADAPQGPASRILLLGFTDPVAIAVDAVGALARLGDIDAGEERPEGGLGRLYLRDGDATRAVDLAALLQRDFQTRRPAPVASPEPAAPAPAEAEAATLAIVTFDLAGQAYGIRLEQVAEVLAAPDHIATLPHTDQAMVGVLPVRDGLVPIVSLRALLGLGVGESSGRERIIVVRIGTSRIGLLADGLRAILRIGADRLEATPAVLNRGAGEARIDAICRLPDGRGLVSLLDPERVFRDETLAQIVADGRQKGETVQAGDAAPQAKIVVFRLGDEEYGLAIGDVDEVLRFPETLTRLPKAPPFVLGVMSLRGHLLPIIDQRRRFRTPGEPPAEGRRVIVTTVGDRQAGFVVDAVTEILTLPAEQLAPASSLAGEGDALFDRVVNLQVEGRIILVVAPQALLDSAERDLLGAFASQAGSPDL